MCWLACKDVGIFQAAVAGLPQGGAHAVRRIPQQHHLPKRHSTLHPHLDLLRVVCEMPLLSPASLYLLYAKTQNSAREPHSSLSKRLPGCSDARFASQHLSARDPEGTRGCKA